MLIPVTSWIYFVGAKYPRIASSSAFIRCSSVSKLKLMISFISLSISAQRASSDFSFLFISLTKFLFVQLTSFSPFLVIDSKASLGAARFAIVAIKFLKASKILEPV